MQPFNDGIKLSKIILYVFLAMVLGFVSGYFLGYQNEPVAMPIANLSDSTCPRYSCSQVMREAAFEILLSPQEALGTGNLFGGNAVIEVPVRNKDSEGAYFTMSLTCQTLKRPASDLASDKIYIGPNQTGTFTLEYEISARENWKCDNFKVKSEAVTGCELKEFN